MKILKNGLSFIRRKWSTPSKDANHVREKLCVSTLTLTLAFSPAPQITVSKDSPRDVDRHRTRLGILWYSHVSRELCMKPIVYISVAVKASSSVTRIFRGGNYISFLLIFDDHMITQKKIFSITKVPTLLFQIGTDLNNFRLTAQHHAIKTTIFR